MVGGGVGAGIGALIGSILPGPGTLVGATVGGVVGGAIGGIMGEGNVGDAGVAVGAGVADVLPEDEDGEHNMQKSKVKQLRYL